MQGQDRSPREDDVDFDCANHLMVGTGDARGIRASGAYFFAQGCQVVIVDRNEQAALAMARVTCGLAAIDAVEEAPRETFCLEAEHGSSAVGVNRASVLRRPLPRGDLTMKDRDLVARITPPAVHVCCRAVGSAAGGSITDITSVCGPVGTLERKYVQRPNALSWRCAVFWDEDQSR
jgi:NAD(P)-dependent dehydrogenase (short-subunit alcohol dehydrogenase family)